MLEGILRTVKSIFIRLFFKREFKTPEVSRKETNFLNSLQDSSVRCVQLSILRVFVYVRMLVEVVSLQQALTSPLFSFSSFNIFAKKEKTEDLQ